MQIVRRPDKWNPFQEFNEISNQMNRLLGLTRFTPAINWPSDVEGEPLATTDWSPSCDISESDTEYRVQAELPNIKKDDVHVTLENGVLAIRGERREEKEEKGVRFHRRELSYGSFVRRFTMPPDTDESKVDATFKDGMLNVVIGKSKKKEATAKEVAVR